jgi:hypothetical protein
MQWSLEHAPCATLLSTLCFGRISAPASIYKVLLACTPHFRVFELDCLQRSQHLPFKLDDLEFALHLVQTTLTRLEVRFELYQDEYVCENVRNLNNAVFGSLGSLRAFAALTSLEVCKACFAHFRQSCRWG